MKKKAFTLIEILIGLVIAGVLFMLIFKAYVMITQITTRLANEKKLNAEIAYMTETVQNIADKYQIDFRRYSSSELSSTYGWSDRLYLTGGDLISGGMLLFTGDNLWWIHGETEVALISSGQALISSGKFKIIPFTTFSLTGSAFLDVQHPGFWLFTTLQIPQYNPQQWIWNVQTSMQQFYNMQRLEN